MCAPFHQDICVFCRKTARRAAYNKEKKKKKLLSSKSPAAHMHLVPLVQICKRFREVGDRVSYSSQSTWIKCKPAGAREVPSFPSCSPPCPRQGNLKPQPLPGEWLLPESGGKLSWQAGTRERHWHFSEGAPPNRITSGGVIRPVPWNIPKRPPAQGVKRFVLVSSAQCNSEAEPDSRRETCA